MTNEQRSTGATLTTHDHPGTKPPDPHRWRWAVLAVVLAAEVMDLLDATIIAIAGPSIRADLIGPAGAGGAGSGAGPGSGTAFLQWLAAGYTLAFAVGLVTGGRLGDIFGRRRMFLTGAAGFTLMSLLCAVAPGPVSLVVFRILQGLAGAVLIPQGLGLIKAAFPPEKLGAAFGAFGPVMGLSAVCGPILAGVLVDADLFGTGWRMIFLINLPVGVAALIGAWLVLPRPTPASTVRGGTHQAGAHQAGAHQAGAHQAGTDDRLTLDLTGTVLLSVSLLLLVFPLVQGRELGWPWWAWTMMALSVPAFWLFQRYQQRLHRTGRSPLIEPSLLAKQRFTAGLLVGLIFFAGLMGLTLILSVYLQLGLGFSPLRAGLTQSPWAFGTAVGAIAGHVLSARFGGRRLLVGGTAVLAAGVVALLVTLTVAAGPVSSGAPYAALLASLLVLGIGMGCSMAPYFDIVLASVDEHEVGSASGTLTAAQQVGGAIGVAALGTAFFAWAQPRQLERAFDASLRHVLWLELGLLALAAALSFLLPKRARDEPAAPTANTDTVGTDTGTVGTNTANTGTAGTSSAGTDAAATPAPEASAPVA
ncbi:MFS transporter [Dactylosporangium siamense]|uniref:MFS transporter n=1 Tax=Dactylosporangium siamense TaxID=685454 RepID=UPI001EF20EC4|nr:MFS transporter [Dactylosporangium siamense]